MSGVQDICIGSFVGGAPQGGPCALWEVFTGLAPNSKLKSSATLPLATQSCLLDGWLTGHR